MIISIEHHRRKENFIDILRILYAVYTPLYTLFVMIVNIKRCMGNMPLINY